MADLIQMKTLGGIPKLPMEKKEAHDLMRQEYESGTPTVKDCHSYGIVINRDGYILLQQRPESASDNGGLYDKSWGSHVNQNDSGVTSAMYKSGRELGVPLAVLDDDKFYAMLTCHPDITDKLAITRRLDFLPRHTSERKLPDGSTWDEPCEATVLLSYYDGNIRIPPADGAGLKWYTRETLRDQIGKKPEAFTEDMRTLVAKYYDQLVPFHNLPGLAPTNDFSQYELLPLLDLDGDFIGAAPRKGIHEPLIKAYRTGVDQPSKHRHIRLQLLRSDGSLWLQKRSKGKRENPGMMDKTIGGHRNSIDTYETAMLHELMDELRIPGAVLDKADFKRAVRHRPELLKDQALIFPIGEEEDYVSRRVLAEGAPWKEIGDTIWAIGYYDGEISFKDGEAVGVDVRNVDELRRDIETRPQDYTPDLCDMVERMGHMMVPASEFRAKVLKF